MHLLPSHLKEKGVKFPGNAVYHVWIQTVKEIHRAGITYPILPFFLQCKPNENQGCCVLRKELSKNGYS